MIFRILFAALLLSGIAVAQNIKTVMADTNGVIRGNAALEARIATGGTGAASTNDLAAVSNRVVAVEAGTNKWNAAYGWGNHAGAGYLTSFAETDPFFTAWRGTNDYVKVELDATALSALSDYAATNQVTRLHDSQSARYIQSVENGTGTVWQITGPFTNTLSVTLSEDFLALNGELRPAWTNHTFPFIDGVWVGTTSAASPYAVIGYSDFDAMWADYTGGGILEPANANAQGTATLIPEYTYYTTNVSSRFATDAALTNINANLNACHIAISNQVEGVRDDVDALPSALQPYTLTRYGDLATTNTAGFAGFITTNGTLTSIQTVDPTAGAKLAQFRYDITSTIYGTANWSSWIQSAVGTPDSVTFARMLVYSASDVLIASNDGAVVRINVTSAASNFTASVALPYAVTNGYIVTEIYNVSNTTKNAFVHTGGSYPATLTLSAKPLNYATPAEVATETPYTAWTGTVTPADGTATVTIAHGNMPVLVTAAPCVLTLDPTGYGTAGVSRVSLSYYPGTNSFTFATNIIKYAETPTVDTNGWNTLLIRRVSDGAWKGVGL